MPCTMLLSTRSGSSTPSASELKLDLIRIRCMGLGLGPRGLSARLISSFPEAIIPVRGILRTLIFLMFSFSSASPPSPLTNTPIIDLTHCS